MKTLWDAVNELECGTLKPDWCRYIGYKCHNGFYFLQNDSKFRVCAIAEFNALVEDMSLGLDVNSVTHGELYNYVNADKTLLEKETKPDYTSLEFWKDAPEDAENYMPESDYYIASWVKNISSDGDYSYINRYERGFDWQSARFTRPPEALPLLIKRPQSSPTETPEEKEALDSIVNKPLVYTQEMVDNGELPSVGMVCQALTGILTIKYVGKKVVVSEDFHGEEFMTPMKGAFHAFKPIDQRTKKEKAIDAIVKTLERSMAYKEAAEIIYNEWVGE